MLHLYCYKAKGPFWACKPIRELQLALGPWTGLEIGMVLCFTLVQCLVTDNPPWLRYGLPPSRCTRGSLFEFVQVFPYSTIYRITRPLYQCLQHLLASSVNHTLLENFLRNFQGVIRRRESHQNLILKLEKSTKERNMENRMYLP